VNALPLILTVFVACVVEAVEALTIVLATGITREWRSTFQGMAAALVALAVITAAVGPAVSYLPLTPLRIVVGALLLIFGLQWLRKAILRAAGLKALHDEDAAFTRASGAARDAGEVDGAGIDGYAFLVAFKGAFLEGLEVVFIVLTFGTNQHDVPLAAAAAALAVLLVTVAGCVIHAPLARVPENTLKFVVGVMLTSFGMFWGGEGAGAGWPGGDTSLLGIIPMVAALALVLVSILRGTAPVKAVAG
jgi:uncharacterized membrane protein